MGYYPSKEATYPSDPTSEIMWEYPDTSLNYKLTPVDDPADLPTEEALENYSPRKTANSSPL